jgi:hypothetical protein
MKLTPEAFETFTSATREILREYKHLTGVLTHDEFIMDAFNRDFCPVGLDMVAENSPSIASLIGEMADFAKSWQGVSIQSYAAGKTLSVSLNVPQRNGIGALTLTASAIPTDTSTNNHDLVWADLWLEIKRGYAHFSSYAPSLPMADHTPQVNAGEGSASPQSHPDGNNTIVIESDTLSIENKSNKIYWRLKGGKFQNHGVALWPEYAKNIYFVNGDPPKDSRGNAEPGDYKIRPVLATCAQGGGNGALKVVKVDLK